MGDEALFGGPILQPDFITAQREPCNYFLEKSNGTIFYHARPKNIKAMADFTKTCGVCG
jgi:hypothetical protein